MTLAQRLFWIILYPRRQIAHLSRANRTIISQNLNESINDQSTVATKEKKLFYSNRKTQEDKCETHLLPPLKVHLVTSNGKNKLLLITSDKDWILVNCNTVWKETETVGIQVLTRFSV